MANELMKHTKMLESESSGLGNEEPARGTGFLELLRRVWQRWKRIARRIGDVQARILLIVFYFTVLAPFALVVRWATDPLAIKPGTPQGWRNRRDERGTLRERATRQF